MPGNPPSQRPNPSPATHRRVDGSRRRRRQAPPQEGRHAALAAHAARRLRRRPRSGAASAAPRGGCGGASHHALYQQSHALERRAKHLGLGVRRHALPLLSGEEAEAHARPVGWTGLKGLLLATTSPAAWYW